MSATRQRRPFSAHVASLARVSALAVALVVLAGPAALAQDAASADEEAGEKDAERGFFATYFSWNYWNDWHIGVNVAFARRPYIDSDLRIFAFPLPTRLDDYTFTGQRFAFREGVGIFRFIRKARFDLSLAGRFDGRGYNPDDNDALQGLEQRKFSVEAGLMGAWRGDRAFVEASGTTDVLGRSEGTTYELNVGFPLKFVEDRLQLIPQIAALHFSDSSIDYYFGVRPGEELLPDRPAYAGRSTTNLRISTRGTFRFDNAWALSGRLAFIGLGDGITDSPIVDRNLTWNFDIAVLRRIGGDPKKERQRTARARRVHQGEEQY